MKKVLVSMFLLVFGLSLVGCDIPKNPKYLIAGGVSKKEYPLAVQYKMQRQYLLSEQIWLEISFGTSISLNYRQDSYEAEISVINFNKFKSVEDLWEFEENPSSFPERTIIKYFDEFCEENYPMPINRKFQNTIVCELDTSIFENESGQIIIRFKTDHMNSSVFIAYNIVDDTIYFTEEIKSYGNSI